jgi:DNA primase
MAMTMMKSANDERWENFKEKLGYLKEMVDSRYLVESLGLKITRETPKELRGLCAVHGGDNPTSFRFNKDKKTWVCFSHKCHDIHGNDIIGLIRAMHHVDFLGAVDFLSSLVGDFDSATEALRYRREKEQKEFIGQSKLETYVHYKVNEERLQGYMGHRSSLFGNDGFSDKTLDYFEIAGGYTTNDKLTRDVIPIRNIDGTLVAYSLRDIRPDADYASKYWITPGFDKDNVLYNMQRLVPVDGPLVIVEGFKSVWRLYDYGIKNVVAIMGSKLTLGQQKLLFSNALQGAVIFFDCDVAGAEGAMVAYEALRYRMDVWPVFITEEGKDPADLDKETTLGYLAPYLKGGVK